MAYQKAIRVADQKGFKFEAPYINLGAYYNRLSKPDLALQFAKKAIELNSKSDLGYYQVRGLTSPARSGTKRLTHCRARSRSTRPTRNITMFWVRSIESWGSSRKAWQPSKLFRN